MESIGSKGSPRKQLLFEDSDEERDDVNLMGMDYLKDLDSIHSQMDEKMIPKLETEFETEQNVFEFYLAYAKHVGFGVRKQRSHSKNGKLIDMTICCAAQGIREEDTRKAVKSHRPETRFGCLAKMKVNRNKSGKFCVTGLVLEHNHYLASPNKSHMIRCHRKLSDVQATQIEMSSSVGIGPKKAHELMAKEVGGRDVLGFIPLDYKNYLRTKRQKKIENGDTSGVLEYLQRKQVEDPNFSYAIQVDGFEMVTNIFWCDAKMKADFANFGDVVCFDTTYGKNKEGRPIALFVGVNHHKQSVVFGAALLYDETARSFEWLFDIFSVAMLGAKPKTILTDQDPAMAKALASTWPETNHRLCIWHIYQNAAIHLSHVFSEFKNFTRDFKSCIYDFEEEEDFFKEWRSMLDKYDLNDNAWLNRLFEIREKWYLVYGRQVWCGDMTTTQRSESMNALLKQYVSYQNKFLDFFDNFERMIENRRYDELVADFKANSTIPVLKFPGELNKHAASVYTPEVFELFEQECFKSVDSSCEECEANGAVRRYKVTPVRKRYHHMVTHDTENDTFDCSCKKFQFAGILCSHVVKIMNMKGIIRIPDSYILKRWTRKAKSGHVGQNDIVMARSGQDAKVLYRLRYKDLCQLHMQLATKAAETEDTYITARNRLLETLDIVDAGLQSSGKSVDISSANVTSSTTQMAEFQCGNGNTIKGVKSKMQPSSGKRKKGALEKLVGKKKSRGNVKKKSCDENALLPPQEYHPTIPFSTIPLPTIPVGSLDQTNWPAIQRPQLHVGASHMLNPTYYGSYSVSQSSQVHGSSSLGNDDVQCTCSVRCQRGAFCPSTGFFV